MLRERVTKGRGQSAKIFETLVDGLMASTDSIRLLSLVPERLVIGRRASSFVPVRLVGVYHLTIGQLMIEAMLEDRLVFPRAALEWPIDPTDLARPDVQRNFIPHSRPLELVAVPAAIEASFERLIDAAISAIDGELDDVSDIVVESIFKSDLYSVGAR